MGKARCPICVDFVEENANYCQRCGAVFEENTFICSRCGSALPLGTDACTFCGADYGTKEFTCPICNVLVSSDAVICPYCGIEFEENVFRCPHCGVKINRETEVCPSCQNRLVEEVITETTDESTGEEGATEEKKRAGGEDEGQKVKRLLFPFTAIVGQEMMKKSLLLNAINPEIGGVLLKGERGTAKSVTVRALAEVLPPMEVVKDCRFSCDPKEVRTLCWECRDRLKEGPLPTELRPMRVVTLPLNATEDRVVGSIDIDKMLSEGLKAFEPGILADANRGILYVDEINLLDDFIVDILLDAAAMGVAVVEREGVSVSYPAKFIIVGSMNPEEGGLRPQLLDRIALLVDVKGIRDIQQRKAIVQAREEATKDIVGFRRKYLPANERLKQRIIRARELLPNVKIDDRYIDAFGQASIEFRLDGHRADIMMRRTAVTNAAYEGRDKVTFEDLLVAGEMVIPHRLKRDVFEAEEFSRGRLEAVYRSITG